LGKGNTLAGKKTPTRQCIGCGDKKDKKELIRVIKTPEGEITVDFTGKKNGRGAYICNSTECLKQAVKKKSLERSLKTPIPKDIYQELEKEMIKGES